jgi:hypothetical protein
MAQIKVKRSSIPNKAPIPGDLDLGELAVNTYDGKLYLKKNNGTESIVELGGGSFGSGTTGLDFKSYTATAGQTTFAVTYAAPNITVVVNGAVLHPTDYTATNGTSIVLASGCALGDVVSVYGFSALSVGYGLPTQTGNSGKYLFTDGSSVSWQTVSGGGGGGGADLSAVAQNILPSTDIAYDLGSTSKRWRDLYLSGTTINLGGAVITSDPTSGAIALVPKPTVSNPNPSGIVVSPSGGVSSVSSTGGVVSNQSFADSVQATAAPGPVGGVFYENAQTVTANYTLSANKNALTAGPITVATGVVVTISTGSRWVIV